MCAVSHTGYIGSPDLDYPRVDLKVPEKYSHQVCELFLIPKATDSSNPTDQYLFTAVNSISFIQASSDSHPHYLIIADSQIRDSDTRRRERGSSGRYTR
jgi:hypothetical protein